MKTQARRMFGNTVTTTEREERFTVDISAVRMMRREGQIGGPFTETRIYTVRDTQTGAEWRYGPDEHGARQLASELNVESMLR